MAEENKSQQKTSVPPEAQDKLQSSKEHARRAAEDLKSAAGAFADEYRGKAEPGLLTSGELGGVPVQKVVGQVKLRGDLRHPLWQVRSAERQPAMQRGVIRVVGAGITPAQGRQRRVQVGLSTGNVSPAAEVPGQ